MEGAMWAIVNLDEVSGTFKTVSQFATAEECARDAAFACMKAAAVIAARLTVDRRGAFGFDALADAECAS
jgi:hypothetical protein